MDSRKMFHVSSYPPHVDKLVQEREAALVARHRVLIDKFLEITERKVRVVDDYGDENWEALDKEIEAAF